LWIADAASAFHHAHFLHALVMFFFKTLVAGHHGFDSILETLIVWTQIRQSWFDRAMIC
jgi:hypothetical protein